jgi:ribosomal protein L11 methyltransferase
LGNRLWEIAVTTLPEAEEAVTDMLAVLSRQSCASFTDVEAGTVRVSVFLAGRKRPGGLLRRRISTGLRTIKGWGLNVGGGRVSCRRVRPQDWAESWKRHFKPIEIGRVLLVKPSWSRRRPNRDQAVVVLDPGLSFGTGQHPTTAFCLEQLVRFRPRAAQGPGSFLDIGTGSGILAIAAAKLGFAPVEAFDFDPEAVRVAKANARENGVARRVQFFRSDVLKLKRRKLGGQCSIVCANLTADLLIKARSRIVSCMKQAGLLVLAGILREEFPRVQKRFESAGLEFLGSRSAGEWRSAAFARRSKIVTIK